MFTEIENTKNKCEASDYTLMQLFMHVGMMHTLLNGLNLVDGLGI